MHARDLRDFGYSHPIPQGLTLAGGGTLRTLREWDFRGWPSLSASTGTYYLDGEAWDAAVPANSSVTITQGTGLICATTAGSAGVVPSWTTATAYRNIVGFNRMAFGNVQTWSRLSAYTMGSGVVVSIHQQYGHTPAHGVSVRRAANVYGVGASPGGIHTVYFWGGESFLGNAVASSADVYMINQTGWFDFDCWIGTWSDATGWPQWQDMTFHHAYRFAHDKTVNSRANFAPYTTWQFLLGMYGVTAHSFTWDRARVTTIE